MVALPKVEVFRTVPLPEQAANPKYTLEARDSFVALINCQLAPSLEL